MNHKGYSSDQLLEVSGGDKKFACGLLKMFLDQGRKDLQTVRNLTEEKKWEEIKFVAHRLRSSAGSVGANGIAKTCSELETYIKTSVDIEKDVYLYVENFQTTTVTELAEIEAEMNKLTGSSN